jgi:hypothetical protein
MIRFNRTIPLVAVLVAIVVAGCGSSGSGGGGSSEPSPASLAAPGSVVFVEGNLKPTGALKSNVDSVAKTLAGIDNLGDFVVSELESSAGDEGEPLDFATEVEPWLGKRAGVAFSRLEGSELSEPLIAIETTDAKAAQAFIDKQSKEGKDPYKDVTYQGVEFKVGGPEGNAIGVIGEWVVIADSEKEFKAAVDASEGESLGDEDRFQTAIDAASNGSLADVYVDVGGIVEQSEGKIDPQAREILQSTGIDPSEATAVASVVPQSDHIEIDLSSDLSDGAAPTGDTSALLGSLPAESLAAVAFSDLGEQLEKAIDNLDETGIPPSLPPHQLKSTLSQAGINLDDIAASLEDGAVFVEGSNRSSLRGALVLTTDGSNEATSAIASLGTLLRGARVPGVTAVSGKASGFSIRSRELGRNPVVVVAKGDRIAIGYGLTAALAGLDKGSQQTLSENPGYQAVVSSLGKMPIVAYANGPEARHLAEVLVPRSNTDFWKVVPYLKLSYIGLGTTTDGERVTAKLIAGLGS